MMFLEHADGVTELTTADVRVYTYNDPACVRVTKGDNYFDVFTGPEPACRAVLERITNAIDGSSDRRVIRRHVYLPKENP